MSAGNRASGMLAKLNSEALEAGIAQGILSESPAIRKGSLLLLGSGARMRPDTPGCTTEAALARSLGIQR